MHSAALGVRDLFGIFVALALLGCVLALPTAAGAARDPEPTVAAADHAELLQLAERAKAAFRRRMEPPPIQIPVLTILERDRTAIVRDYARELYEAAIDALLAEARTPERARAVKAALRQLVNWWIGEADIAEAIFKEILERKAAEGEDAKRDAAAAERHSVALVELPEALAHLIHSQGDLQGELYREERQRYGLPPLGQKAGGAYVRAAKLDPDDPWTWVVLAQLANTPEDLDRAIQKAEKAALNAGDRRAMIAALHVYGLAHTKAGRHAQAEQAHTRALAVGREWTNGAPESVAAQRYLALSLNRLGDTQKEQRRYDEAATAYQEALAVRHRLAEAQPDDPQRQIDLIAAHTNLFVLANARDDKSQVEAHVNEAQRVYNALLARDPFEPSINPLQQSGAVTALILHVLIIASVLTLLIGLIALARYRRVVARWMKAAAEAGATNLPVTTISRTHLVQGQGEIPLLLVEAAKPERVSRFCSAAIAGAARASRRAAWVYTVAGLAMISVSPVLAMHLAGIEMFGAGVIGGVLSYGWPVVLTLALLWGPDRRRLGLLVIGYIGILLAFCTRIAFSETPPVDVLGVTLPPFFLPLVFMAMQAAPLLFLLLFLNRRVRAIGPILLLPMIIIGIGGVAATVGFSTYAGITVKRLMPFLGYRVPFLPLFEVVNVIGMLLFLPLGWLATAWVRSLYDRKWFSEQSLVFDSIWLLQTFILCVFTVEKGRMGWLGLSVFAVYKLITWIGLRPLATAAAERSPARLLLLRTFGFRRRTERFFDLLSARWRYAGPIQMIAAPDLAARSIDPDEFLDFLSGRLRHRFIIEPGDLERRFAEVDNRPDPDGRYRVNEFFCGNDAWRPAVTRLMAESDLVAMDLRGFSAANQGCLFELQSLIDIVPVARIVLLTDKSTDASFLRQTLAECWQGMDAASPNRQATGALILLQTGGRDVAAVAILMAIADRGLAPAETPLVQAAAVRELSAQRIRRAARRLYEQFLISPEGRRVDLKVDIRKQLNLFPGTLLPLVTKRLSRPESQSESSYYQLSHDALIKPVLATRRWKALLFGWLGLGISYIGFAVLGILAILVAKQIILTTQWPILAVLLIALGIASPGIALLPMLRKSIRTLRRYRPRTPEEIADAMSLNHSKMNISYASIGILAGGGLFFVALFFEAFLVVNILHAYMGNLTTPDPFLAPFRQSIAQMGIGLDTIALIITSAIVLLFGARVLRWGIPRLLQTPHVVPPQPIKVAPHALAFSGLGVVAGAIGLIAAMISVGTELVEISCAHYSQGQLPEWVPSNWFNMLAHYCNESYNTGYNTSIFDLIFLLIALTEASLILWRNLVKMRVFHHARSRRVLGNEIG